MVQVKELLVRAREGDRVALSRLMSIIERHDRISEEVLRIIGSHSDAYIVGFVGPPGAGKSTLISRLAPILTSNERLAIISVDPSSPLYGGAILGNRVRMLDVLGNNENIYMRSFSSGSMIGGLSLEVFMAVKLLGYCGYRLIIIEGVGAGQLDYKPLIYSHTRIVVLTPLSGDLIQMIKSGIMELGDIYVINKADQPGAETLRSLLEEAIRAATSIEKSLWKPPVVLTIAIKDAGIKELSEYIKKHRSYSIESGVFNERSRLSRIIELREMISASINDTVNRIMSEDKEARSIVEDYIQGNITYQDAVSKILSRTIELLSQR